MSSKYDKLPECFKKMRYLVKQSTTFKNRSYGYYSDIFQTIDIYKNKMWCTCAHPDDYQVDTVKELINLLDTLKLPN